MTKTNDIRERQDASIFLKEDSTGSNPVSLNWKINDPPFQMAKGKIRLGPLAKTFYVLKILHVVNPDMQSMGHYLPKEFI